MITEDKTSHLVAFSNNSTDIAASSSGQSSNVDVLTYQKRKKATRTKVMGRVWSALETGKRPSTFGWLNSERIQINPDYEKLVRAAGLDTIEGVFSTSLGTIISQDRKKEKNDVLRLEIDDDGVTRVFYLKRYWNRETSKIWKRSNRGSLFGASMVRAEYEMMEKLGEYGLRIPKLVAYGDQRFCCGVVNSFIITEEIPKAMGVDFAVGEWMEQQSESQQQRLKNELIEEIARCLKIMHTHGFEHHDLFLRNMMVSGQEMSALYVLDCPRAYIWPQLIMRFRRVHDLATLDAAGAAVFSPQQRMRFMHIYLGRNRLNKGDKALIRKVFKCASPMRERQVTRLERSIAVDAEGNILS